MSVNSKYFAPFIEGEFFHVYNRTNGSHKLCRDDENYRYFINQFEFYLNGVLDIYSFCVLPSHFHYIVRIKQLLEMQTFLKTIKSQSTDINKIVVKQFQAFFTSYTMSFNKYHERQGSLFNHRFKRVQLEADEHLMQSIFYVHSNPVHHSLTKSFIEYPYSSYPLILSDKPTIIKREEILNLFGGREEFIRYHHTHKPVIAKPWLLE
jgi:putative transposase